MSAIPNGADIQSTALLYAKADAGLLWHLGRCADVGNGAILLYCGAHVLHSTRATMRHLAAGPPAPLCGLCLHNAHRCARDCHVCARRAAYNAERRR